MKLEYLEPQSKEAIDTCKRQHAKLFMMIDGYQTDVEALILRDMLWYARDKGVEVLIVPKSEK